MDGIAAAHAASSHLPPRRSLPAGGSPASVNAVPAFHSVAPHRSDSPLALFSRHPPSSYCVNASDRREREPSLRGTMALSKTTQDHDEIRKWAEARNAKPAEVASTEKNGEPGILRIEFPQAKNHNDSNLKEISWDDFFAKFDASDLALVYQDVTKEGAESNFNRLIHPDHDDHPKSGKSAAARPPSGKKASASESPVKAPAKKSAIAK